MYGKSRMTISTTLRPDNVARYKQLGERGVRMEAKRCKRTDHLDLVERHVERHVFGQWPRMTQDELLQVVETMAPSIDSN